MESFFITIYKFVEAAESGAQARNRRWVGKGAYLDISDRANTPNVACIRAATRRL